MVQPIRGASRIRLVKPVLLIMKSIEICWCALFKPQSLEIEVNWFPSLRYCLVTWELSFFAKNQFYFKLKPLPQKLRWRLKDLISDLFTFVDKIKIQVDAAAPPSPMGYIVRKANIMKRCPKVKQNMRINMVLMIFDNIVWFKRNLKK